MAVYDISDMDELTKDMYLRLRDPPVKSPRESATMAKIKIDRRLYDFVEERTSPNYTNLEDVGNGRKGNIIEASFYQVHDGKQEELDQWYREEHLEMLSKVPGWLRTRRFVTSAIDSKASFEFLALHEFSPSNGFGGSEFQAAISTPWSKNIDESVVKWKNLRGYDLYYTFGPAPRYLSSQLADWELTDPQSSRTRTFSSSVSGNGAIESWITTVDGVEIPYRLEGSSDPDAPLIVLSNSILVTYGIWDGFIEAFFSNPENRKYRVLRYLKRGRNSKCGETKITVDVLAADIISLLDALRVKQAAAIVGVSLGGCTTLNTALKYPERVASFVSCDTSAKSPAGNSKAWGQRIEVAESESAISPTSSEKIVGGKLAELTTKRWFLPASYDGGELEKKCWAVNEMVKNNSLEGFKKSVEALFEYDLQHEMKSAQVQGMFLVGGGDGVLPGTMKTMSEEYGNGARYQIIDGAGHLPMVEKPREVAEAVSTFLAS